MTKGLMDRALHQEMALERVHEKARLTDEELLELKSWKLVTEQKLKLAEQTRDEYQRMTEDLKTVLEDKENKLCLAKEKAVQEYRDSDAFLIELGTSYNDGFDDALRQAKALYPKLDFFAVNINVARLCPFSPMLLMIQLNFLQRKGPSPSSPSFTLKKEKPMKPKTPSSLMCRHLFTYFF